VFGRSPDPAVSVILGAFDLLVLGDRPIAHLSYQRRRRILEALGVDGPGVVLTPVLPHLRRPGLFAATGAAPHGVTSQVQPPGDGLDALSLGEMKTADLGSLVHVDHSFPLVGSGEPTRLIPPGGQVPEGSPWGSRFDWFIMRRT
jgi:hypothetical protein